MSVNTHVAVLCLLAIVLRGQSTPYVPNSVDCTFERVATASVDKTGKLTTETDSSAGDLVLANLNSAVPVARDSVGAVSLQVLRKSVDAIWLAEMKPTEGTSTITLFFRTNIVMYSKHEIFHGVDGDRLFGFVEIGRCRPLR